MLLEYEQGSLYEWIQGKPVQDKSWKWEEQCLHSEGGVGMLQSEGNLIVMSAHFWKDSS